MPSKIGAAMELDFLERVNNIFYVIHITPLKGIYAKRRILRS